MQKIYERLTYEQRCQIYTLNTNGFSQIDIAKEIGKSQSAVSRELKRNSGNQGYDYKEAHKLAMDRQQQVRTRPRIMVATMIEKIHQWLSLQWSPVQIAGRSTLEGNPISHETIYQYIRKDRKLGGDLYKQLRRAGKKYNKRLNGKKAGRGCIPNRVDIKNRPSIVEDKSRDGDWEGDLIIGVQHQGAILTYVDRKSKFTLMSLLPDKKSDNVKKATISCFDAIARLVKTITYDNGKEFSCHEFIAKHLNTKCFFATPYHSWERGLNEHTNGLIRQYFPKGTNLLEVTKAQIEKVQNLLNNRPRKVLGFRTPKEVFAKSLSQAERYALGI